MLANQVSMKSVFARMPQGSLSAQAPHLQLAPTVSHSASRYRSLLANSTQG